MIEYKLRLASPQAHLLEVELSIDKPDPAGQVIYLPAWIRGSYLIRDYARHINAITVYCSERDLALHKIDKQSWRIEPIDDAITICYRVYAWELSVRAAHFDTNHAYFNGPALFLGVSGQESMSCRLEILPPEDPQLRGWKVAIAMLPEKLNDHGFGTYIADHYEALIDCPAEIGHYSESEFWVDKRPHRFVVSGSKRFDHELICKHLAAICKKQVDLFGELPVQNYLFLLRLVDKGYGGLEHQNSTSLIFSREDLPSRHDEKIASGYRKLLALCSHEYFHLWNVKRITPKVFVEQGTLQEAYTRQLWIFEGITSYYDELMLVRSGVIEREAYFEMLAESVTRVMRGSGRHKQTLEESSFDAWTKFYKQDENAPNAIVSYYGKGALFALVLDLTIRLQSGGNLSLDQVMREMWLRFGKTGRGVPEQGFEEVVAEVTSLDLKGLFDLGVRSTTELPLEECLHAFGVAMKLLPARTYEDLGGVKSRPITERKSYPVLGAKCMDKRNIIRVQQVFDDGAAQSAGLSAGDEIVAVDGLRMNLKQMDNYIADTEPGGIIKLHLIRRDQLMIVALEPQEASADTCYFYFMDQEDTDKQRRQADWLQGHVR
jgi:predicted metalloprotease with PDZ domain